MGDLTFGIRLTADGKQLVGEVRASREEFDKLGTSAQRAAGKMASEYSGLNQTVKQHTAAVTDTERSVSKLLDRYDPLGVKLRQLQADFKALDSAAASGKIAGRDDARVDAVYAKMRQEMEGAGKASVNLGLNTQYARREMMMLGKEALTGDFSRMPQTVGALATHSNLLQAAMSPAGIAIAATAAAAGGLAVAFIQGARETKAMNDAIAYTGDYAGVTRGQMIGLAAEISRTSTLTIGASKEIVTQLVSSGRIGEQSLGAIAQMADTYAAATGKNIDTIGADLAKLFDDPAKGAEELNKRMHFLNAADLEYINHLVRIGEEEKARLVLADKFNASVPKHVENIGLLEKAWNAAAKGASAFWSGAMGVGQANTAEETLQLRIEAIAKLNARGQAIPIGLQNEYSALVAQLNKENAAASAKAAAASNNDQGIAAQALIDKALKLDRIHAKEDEIARLDAANKKELVDTRQYLEARKVLEKELADLQSERNQKSYRQSDDGKAERDYKQITESANGRIAVLKAQSDETDKLTESEKKLIEFDTAHHVSKNKLIEQSRLSARAALEEAAALEKTIQAQQFSAKSIDELAKADAGQLKDAKSQFDAQLKYNDAIGLSRAEVDALTAAKLDKSAADNDELATMTETAAKYAGEYHAAYVQHAADLRAIAEAQRGTAAAKRAGAGKEVAVEQGKRAVEAWKNFSRDIESSLTDAIQRGLEKGGRDGAQVALDTIKNTLKTIPIKIVTQAIVNPIMGGIQGMAQGGSFAGGAGGNGAMDYLSAGQTIWSGFSGGMALNLGSMAMSAGEMFGSAALTEFGVGATYVGGGGTIAGAAAGSTAAGIGASVATAMPYVAAAYAAYSLLGGNHGTPTANTGNASMQFDATGQRTGYQTYYGGSNASTDAVITGMQTSYMQAAMSLGIEAAATSFSYGGNTGRNGQSPNFALGGGAGGVNFYQAETAASDAAVQLAASRAVFAALQGSDLPDYLRSVFDGLTASSATQQQIAGTLAFAQSLKTLRDSLAETRTPLEIAQAQMADLTAEFSTSAATFKHDFIAAIDGGVTPATIARWQQLGAAIDQVTAAQEQAAAAAKQAAQAEMQAARASAMSVVDGAYNSLLRALDAEMQVAQTAQQVAQEQVTAVRSVLDAVGGAVQRLRSQVSGAAAMDAAAGGAFIEQALATAQASGYLPDAGQLQDAIAAATAGIDGTVYASQFEADRARLVLAGQLSQLGAVSGDQLTIAEQQLAAAQEQIAWIDEQRAAAKDQIDQLNGIRVGVLSLHDALAQFGSAVRQPVLGAANAYAAVSAAQIRDYVAANGLQTAQQMYSAAVAHNVDPYAVGAAYGLDRAATDAALAGINRLPGFASGGDHLGGLRIVGERGPELEFTGPSRIFNADQTRQILNSSDSQRLEVLVVELTNEVKRLQALVGETNHNTRRTAEAVNGNPDQPMLVETVV